ncbi:hypothetical protein M0R72_03110 [Candidatus Pacearchaeota archaeon]|jgi:uncharacterized membrane protein YuzA (DUF378 family)|nr:hypothetical protein [Candidatus Pacearchaeota archaeon]
MQNIKKLIFKKILIGIVLLLTVLLGIQGLSLGIFGFNIFTWITSGTINYIRGYYVVTGIATIITSILLFVKVYLKK